MIMFVFLHFARMRRAFSRAQPRMLNIESKLEMSNNFTALLSMQFFFGLKKDHF